ncbi:MAG: hypothetical protein GYB67_00440 [Chloroflexi bacterium]|nr:hypothetical protein [Chloroflexota bacterium]
MTEQSSDQPTQPNPAEERAIVLATVEIPTRSAQSASGTNTAHTDDVDDAARQQRLLTWRTALIWGFGAALIHRVLLMIWLPLIWTVIGAGGGIPADFHATANANLPRLESPAEQTIFGVWRRWDAVHYLNLAYNGYRPGFAGIDVLGVPAAPEVYTGYWGFRSDDPGPTVFGLLTPLGIRAFDLITPGPLDLGAVVFETLAFGLALTMLFRVVVVYYRDPGLAPWSVAVLALLPLSFFFAAPMSESIYLALVLALFYYAARDRWLIASICGFLATLARSQGVLLTPITGLLLLEAYWHLRRDWLYYGLVLFARGWPIAIISLGFMVFEVYRSSLDLPSVSRVYSEYSYNFFSNPINGLIINLRWFFERPEGFSITIDQWALVLALSLGIAALFFRKHRRIPLIAYTFVFLLLFVSRINYLFGTDIVLFTQSIGRYTLVLFPIWVLLADGLRSSGWIVRVAGVGVLLLGLAFFSGLYVFALTPP